MPSLNAYVDQNYRAEQRQTVRLALSRRNGGRNEYMTDDRTQQECERLLQQDVKTIAGRPGFHFIGFDQATVDGLGGCLVHLRSMLETAQQHVGEYYAVFTSKYEEFFGTRAWHGSSATKKAGLAAGNAQAQSGFESRSAYVRARFAELVAALDERWLFVKSNVRGDAASLAATGSYQISIGPAFPKGPPAHFHAGVLIHEMGHNLGLADVCQICHAHHLRDSTHFVDRGRLACNAGQNGPHGDLAGDDNGHYIGSKRVRKLASDHKNMSVFNTDSYRWFCCAYYEAEVNRQRAEHVRLKAAAAAR